MSYGDKRWAPWVVEEEESLPLIKQAFDAGINFFDTGNVTSQIMM
jgi:aryl-alcohol dehydrogenase-like predicted oxidoreductase